MKEQFVIYENPIQHRTNVGSHISIVTDNETSTIPISPIDWLCDFCNSNIQIFDEQEIQMSVFVLNNNNALCMKCFFEVIKKDRTMADEFGLCQCCMDKEVTDEHRIVFRNIESKELKGNWQGFMRFKSEYQLARFLSQYYDATGEMVLHDKLNKGKFEKAKAKAKKEQE